MSDNLSSRAHKVVLSADSYIKGFATAIQSALKSDYKLLSVMKPGRFNRHAKCINDGNG